jgi:hypothetical protein
MTRTAPRSRALSGARTALLSVLVVALLAPVGALFASSVTDARDREAATRLEADGVAYLRSLGQLTFTLAEAQTTISGGGQPNVSALTAAVRQAEETDQRLGDKLRTHERWKGLRSRIEGLAGQGVNAKDPAQLQRLGQANTEIGNLLLGLYTKVRDRSGLAHDPDADAYNLQLSVARGLPAAIIAAGQLADLTLVQLPPNASDILKLGLVAAVAKAQADLELATGDLVEGLQAAVDTSESQTLSGSLLGRLDRFSRTAERISAAPTLAGASQPDRSMVPTYRAELLAAGSELSTAIFDEVDGLLNARLDTIEQERLQYLGVAAAAVVIAALLLVVVLAAPRVSRPAVGTLPAGLQLPADRGTDPWGPTVSPVQYPLQGGDTTQWERAGASR